jgi:hypothetical protein
MKRMHVLIVAKKAVLAPVLIRMIKDMTVKKP